MEELNDYDRKRQALNLLRRRYKEQQKQVARLDPRLKKYFDGMVTVSDDTDSDPNDPQPAHNYYELLGGVKFLRLLRTYPFNLSKFKQVLALREGKWQPDSRGRWQYVEGGFRQPLTTGDRVLRWEPFQVFILASIYGFHAWISTGANADERENMLPTERIMGDEVEDLRRLCNNFVLFGPRKIDKTGISAFVAQEHFLLEDTNSESYCCANSADQSKLLFRRIKHGMLQMNFDDRFRITETVIDWRAKYQNEGHNSSIRPLSAGGKTKDGMFAQLCCADEYGSAAYTNGKSDMKMLVDVVESSMGPRREPLTVTTTTAGRITEGPFIDKLESLHRLLELELQFDAGAEPTQLSYDRQMCLLLEPDEWEKQDEGVLLSSKSVRRKINPMLGKIVQYQFYDDTVAKARLDGDLGEVTSKLFNVYCTQRVKDWVTQDEIRAIQIPMRIDDCTTDKGWEVTVGSDFSKGDDLNGNSYLAKRWREDLQEMEYFADMDSYMSEAAVEKSPIRDLLLKWAADGWLHIVPGKTFDPAVATNRIIELNDKDVNFFAFGYDPFNAKTVINVLSIWLSDMGLDPKSLVIPVRQNFATYSPAVKEFDYMLHRGIQTPDGKVIPNPMIHLSANPLWPWEFGNCQLAESTDGMENLKPVKATASASCKVDNIQMMLTALILHDQLDMGVLNTKANK